MKDPWGEFWDAAAAVETELQACGEMPLPAEGGEWWELWECRARAAINERYTAQANVWLQLALELYRNPPQTKSQRALWRHGVRQPGSRAAMPPSLLLWT